MTRSRIGNYIQPLTVPAESELSLGLFRTAEMYKARKPGLYTLLVSLYLWSSSTNLLYETETLRIPVRVSTIPDDVRSQDRLEESRLPRQLMAAAVLVAIAFGLLLWRRYSRRRGIDSTH